MKLTYQIYAMKLIIQVFDKSLFDYASPRITSMEGCARLALLVVSSPCSPSLRSKFLHTPSMLRPRWPLLVPLRLLVIFFFKVVLASFFNRGGYHSS